MQPNVQNRKNGISEGKSRPDDRARREPSEFQTRNKRNGYLLFLIILHHLHFYCCSFQISSELVAFKIMS